MKQEASNATRDHSITVLETAGVCAGVIAFAEVEVGRRVYTGAPSPQSLDATPAHLHHS